MDFVALISNLNLKNFFHFKMLFLENSAFFKSIMQAYLKVSRVYSTLNYLLLGKFKNKMLFKA